MPVDVRKIAIAAAQSALHDAVAPPQRRRRRTPGLGAGKAFIVGAGLMTAGRMAVRARGGELLEPVRSRLEDLVNGVSEDEQPVDEEVFDEEPVDEEPEAQEDDAFDGEEEDEEPGAHEEDEEDEEPEAHEEDEEPEAHEEDFEDEGEDEEPREEPSPEPPRRPRRRMVSAVRARHLAASR